MVEVQLYLQLCLIKLIRLFHFISLFLSINGSQNNSDLLLATCSGLLLISIYFKISTVFYQTDDLWPESSLKETTYGLQNQNNPIITGLLKLSVTHVSAQSFLFWSWILYSDCQTFIFFFLFFISAVHGFLLQESLV